MKRLLHSSLILLLLIASCTDEQTEEPIVRDGNSITAFTVSGGGLQFQVTIDGTNITVVAPYNIQEVLDLSLTAQLSEGATISPDPATITNLDEPVTFTVTAENGTERRYTVTLRRELSPENAIIGIVLTQGQENLEIELDPQASEITYEVPTEWNLSEISASIEISQYASIDPDPATISDYSQPVVYRVTAEDGGTRQYTIDLSKVESEANFMKQFSILSSVLDIPANINQETGEITQKLPPDFDLGQLSVSYEIDTFATVEPDPAGISDYSSPVSIIVTSESGSQKEYTISFSTMETPLEVNCDVENASRWFGGDSRGDKVHAEHYFAPRNVGTGQTLMPQEDTYLTTFAVRFQRYFHYYDDQGDQKVYFGQTTIRLNIRNAEGEILATADHTFDNPMTLLWQTFDLSDQNIVLKKNVEYKFTWYLLDGETLGIYTGSHGNQEEHGGWCDGQGMGGTSTIREETSLEDWEVWGNHSWHFNFRLRGMN